MNLLAPRCPECGKEVTTIKNQHPNFRQEQPKGGSPSSRHISTTYTFACKCGKVFTRIIPVK